jgi:TupA-like ATPgrasp
VERLLVGPDGNPPLERSLFVFNGRVRLILTNLIENGKMRHGACHDQNWNELPWHSKTPRYPGYIPRPQQLGTLIDQAERLGSEVDHVRIDTYDLGDRFYIGELTVYTWSGFRFFTTPVEADSILGSYWRILNTSAKGNCDDTGRSTRN